MKTKFCSVLILTLSFLHAQKIALGQVDDKPSPFSISAYIETYYVYDFNKPENNTRPSFIYSYNRHNEVNLNLGFIRGSYTTDKVRANLALMTGTYANANLAVEPGEA
jgi:Putative beta-barrel porin-2, OmpL-like. bbp2